MLFKHVKYKTIRTETLSGCQILVNHVHNLFDEPHLWLVSLRDITVN